MRTEAEKVLVKAALTLLGESNTLAIGMVRDALDKNIKEMEDDEHPMSPVLLKCLVHNRKASKAITTVLHAAVTGERRLDDLRKEMGIDPA